MNNNAFWLIVLIFFIILIIYELVKMCHFHMTYNLMDRVFNQWSLFEILLFLTIVAMVNIICLLVFWQAVPLYISLKYFLHLWGDHYEKNKAV